MRIEVNTESLRLLKDRMEGLADAIGEGLSRTLREGTIDAEAPESKEFMELAVKLTTELKSLADGVCNDVARRTELIEVYRDAAYGHAV